MKHQDWQRDSRDDPLSADSNDASLSVQTWLHRRQRTRANPLRRFANVFGVLAVFAFSFYLLTEHNGLGDLLKAKTNGLLNPIAPAIALPSIDLDRPTPGQPADPYRIPQHFEPIQPNTLTSRPLKNVGEAAETRQKQARTRSLRGVNEQSEPVFNAVSATQVVFQQPASTPIAIPKPLADCIDTVNLIDENVIACRYGTLPRDQRPAPSSGMVSAQYLAQYKAEQANRSNAPARRSASREVDQVWIERWDGGGSYLAEWHSLNNRIDSSSVCLNHRRGSIDYRECRKAAKVHFREQCRAWEKRWARDRDDLSKQMEQRYCSAANGFSPMG